MTLVTLRDVLQPALKGGYAVGGVVTLGWEDMRAYVAAAEAEGCPVILQAGPGCRAHTPLAVWARCFDIWQMKRACLSSHISTMVTPMTNAPKRSTLVSHR